MSEAAPLTFGRYEALFHIASGGMAEVFAARLSGPAGFEKLVAVKRLLPELDDERFVGMFLDEARLAAHISSPNVVQTYELGRADDDGALYIVMELVVGITLFELCVNAVEGPMRGMPIPIVVEIMAQAAHGASDAHEATTPTGNLLHVIHRDISPQNILVGVDGRVRVTDFGIARAVSRSTETQVGQLKGKVAYVAPEQARGQELDPRCDVFALGVVTWEALTGKSLFNTGEPIETIQRVLNLPIPSPAKFRPDVPDALAEVVLWALQRDRDKRCPSAARFERALRDAIPGAASGRDISAFVHANGGPPLARIKKRINEIHSGHDRTVMRPPPTAKAHSSRLFPDAEVSSARLIGRPSDAPPRKRSQRELPTEEIPPENPYPSRGAGKLRTEAPAGRQRRLGAALILGISAWLIAGIVAWLTLAGGSSRRDGPALIQAPTDQATNEPSNRATNDATDETATAPDDPPTP